MGLKFPSDVEAWQRWQDSRRPLHQRARSAFVKLRPAAPRHPQGYVAANSSSGPVKVVGVLESRAASSQQAILAPLLRLGSVGSAVVSSFDLRGSLPHGWTSRRVDAVDYQSLFPAARIVLGATHYLPLGASALVDARHRGHLYVTVQHGLLTPFAPPLPAGGPFLAWSQADAQFWASGRPGLEACVVGSQSLWAAAHQKVDVSRFDRPVFLGQLHGAELPRMAMVKAVTEFCRDTGAIYRPHPAERDRLSTMQHRVWERLGIDIDRSGGQFARHGAPVVSIFSTGLVEAAVQGVPAWAFFPAPPPWLSEFWLRYGLRPWGGEPTPAPGLPQLEPAMAIANWMEARL